MKLTHKAIAMMCGYRLFGVHSTDYPTEYQFVLPERQGYQEGMLHLTEEDAWRECCVHNKLIEGEL